MSNNLLNITELAERLNTALEKHIGLLDMAADAGNDYSKSIKLPSTYLNSLKTIEQNQKKISKSTHDLERAEKKLQRQRLADLKLTRDREKAFDRYERQLEREQRLLNRTEGLYNKVQNGINKLTRQYNDLALRKELGGKLTDKEIIQLGMLEAKLGKYQSALKRVDANIGKHQRNVGNYKSAYDGLGWSIAQLTREAPAFAHNITTGFMAISNNIPMLVDELGKLKKANVELAASGKPTVNILKRLGGAIFSWQTLISAGIVLLTVYGSKIVEMFAPIDEAKKKTEEYNKKIKEQNEQLKENIRLRKESLQLEKDLVEGERVVDIFKNLDDLLDDSNYAALALVELSERLSKMGIKDAEKLKDTNILQSDRIKLARNMYAIEEQRIKLEEERAKVDEYNRKKREIEQDKSLKTWQKQIKLRKLEFASIFNILPIQEEINRLQEENERIIGKTVELEIEDENARRKKVKALKSINQETDSYTKQLKEQVKLLEATKNLYQENSKEARFLADQIKFLNDIIKLKPGTEEFDREMANNKKREEMIRRLRIETDKFMNSFATGFFSQSGFGSLAQFFDGTFDKLLAGAESFEEEFALHFNAIAEVAQEAFNFINQSSQQNFDMEYYRLEQNRDLAIQFAGESATAREEIERQYDIKRKQIQRREAEANKEIAQFNILANTAQGIVSALGMTPPNVPLSIAIGAIGLAQLIKVKSLDVPQFWQGGEVGNNQTIMVNDDPYRQKGSNYKEVIETPKGQLYFPQGRNVKMNVPKGTKVHANYNDFVNSINEELLTPNKIAPFNFGSQVIPINNGMNKDDLKEIFSSEIGRLNNTIKNKKSFELKIDQGGFTTKVRNGHTVKTMLNARFTGKGLDV